MAPESAVKATLQNPPLYKKRAKVPHMTAEMLPVLPSQTDIDNPPFAEKPAVAFHVPAEIESRHFGNSAADSLLIRADGKLRNLGNDDVLSVEVCTQKARYR